MICCLPGMASNGLMLTQRSLRDLFKPPALLPRDTVMAAPKAKAPETAGVSAVELARLSASSASRSRPSRTYVRLHDAVGESEGRVANRILNAVSTASWKARVAEHDERLSQAAERVASARTILNTIVRLAGRL